MWRLPRVGPGTGAVVVGDGSPCTHPGADPDAAASLVDGLAALDGLRLDASPLREAARLLPVRLDGLMADNSGHQAIVSQSAAAWIMVRP